MKKLESTFLNMTLVMTIITLMSAGILSYVNKATKPTIDAQKRAKKEQAIKDVLPENDSISEVMVIDGQNVYMAYLNGESVGAAIESAPTSGYCSEIRVMVGYRKDGCINTYSVLSQAETPGLGTKMVEWFKTKSSIEGIIPSDDNLTVSKAGGNVDAITAATISSKAFLRCVRSTAKVFRQTPIGASFYRCPVVSPDEHETAPADSTMTTIPADSTVLQTENNVQL